MSPVVDNHTKRKRIKVFTWLALLGEAFGIWLKALLILGRGDTDKLLLVLAENHVQDTYEVFFAFMENYPMGIIL